jgi:cytochrome c553
MRKIFIVVALVFLASSAHAARFSGNEVEGAKRAKQCESCHGVDGNGTGATAPDPSYPKLGGQYATYLQHSLEAYRSGKRQHAVMNAQAKDLSDADIANLSAYFAAQPAQIGDLSHEE